MKIDAKNIANNLTTPLTAPAYCNPPYFFKNREHLHIIYRTDPEALRKVVPEPLVFDESKPYVKFEVIKMNEVTGFGPYEECGQTIPVSFNGEEGDYIHSMYVNNLPAILTGRELSAYPKKMADPSLYIDNEALVGTLDYGTLRVATATMGYKNTIMAKDKAKAEMCRPMFMIKMVKGYGNDFSVLDLTRAQITNIEIKEAWTGPARLQLFEHVLVPLADLPVREIISATHIICDLTLEGVQPVYNYLTEK